MSRANNPFSDPIMSSSLGSQSPKTYNAVLYDHLQQGSSINFVQARALGIAKLDSHIAEIRKITNVYSRTVRISNVTCLEYSLHPF